MTHLHALAMRTAAAALRDDMADQIGAKPMSSIHSSLCEYANAILALPLEADHAAILEEALMLPEISAMVAFVKADRELRRIGILNASEDQMNAVIRLRQNAHDTLAELEAL